MLFAASASPASDVPPLTKSPFSFLLFYISSCKSQISIIFLCSIIGGFSSTLSLYFIKNFVDVLHSSAARPDFLSEIHWPILCYLLNYAALHVSWRVISTVQCFLQPDLKNRIMRGLFQLISRQPQQFFQEHLAGQITDNIQTLARENERLLFEHAPYIVWRGVTLLVQFALICSINLTFFSIMLVMNVCFWGLNIAVGQQLQKKNHAYAAQESGLSGSLTDVLSHVSTVRLFSRFSLEDKRLKSDTDSLTKWYQKKEFFVLAVDITQGFFLLLLNAVVLCKIVTLKVQGLISVGECVAVLGLTVEMGWILWFSVTRLHQAYACLGKCSQSLAFLMKPCTLVDASHALPLTVREGTITFDNVSFSYPNSPSLFQHLNLIVKGGSKVGLVGYSGSGKTTFVNLILRLYDVTGGALLIDGQNIADVTQQSLHEAIGVMTQTPHLLYRSLRDNIVYGKLDATQEEIDAAAQASYADTFIKQVGYDTHVGGSETTLSGGQKQRLAMARVILKNAPLLVFDEATSQLDSLTEQHVQNFLKVFMLRKTCLIIAHRYSTLLHMDRILVFEKGCIVQDGTHKDLLQQSGLYQDLWNTHNLTEATDVLPATCHC